MRTGWSSRYQAAFFQVQYSVAAACERQIVRDKTDVNWCVRCRSSSSSKNHFAGPEVQVAGRLIGKQNGLGFPTSARASTTRCCSPPDNSPARCDARARSPTSSSLASDSVAALACAPPNQQWHHHVFLRRKLRQQVVNLPDKPNLPISEIRLISRRRAVNLSTSVVYRTPRRTVQTAQKMQQSGLPRTRLPHQGQHFASPHVQRYTRENDQVALARFVDLSKSRARI